MKPDSPQDRAAALGLGAVVLAVVIFHVASHLAVRPDALKTSLLLEGGGLVAGLGATILGLRAGATRRALRSRVELELLPSEEFDPSAEDIEQLIAGLGRVAPRGGWLTRSASAIRFNITTGGDGLLRLRLSVAGRSRHALESALAAYPDVELHEPFGDPPPVSSRLRRVARVRLGLARAAHEPLAETGLRPDLLQGVAAAVANLDPEQGEQAKLVLDARVLRPGEARRTRRRLLHEADRRGPRPQPLDGARRPTSAAHTVERRYDTQGLARKLEPGQPLLQFALALRVEATDRRRALETTRALMSSLDSTSAANHLRARGLRLGPWRFRGADRDRPRGRFERDLASGRFRARRRDIACARELQGLLKPPTVHCHADNVARSRGAIPAPPRDLVDYHGQPDVLPLGRVHTRTGERVVGVRVAESFFTYMSGRSRYGKTELAIVRFVAWTLAGRGGLFMDPHGDAIAEIKSYLTAAGVRDRVVEIDLSERKTTNNKQPGWNLFGLNARTPAEAAARVDAFVDAFAAALRWDERNTRALNLATQAAQALTELALALPPELAPTIFEVPVLLSDDAWREAVLPRLRPATRGFFTDRFPSLPGEAITAVTNVLDRLRASQSVAALLGSPVSTYDARRALANDSIVLVCPGPGSSRDSLVANLVVYDVLHALKARGALPPSARTPFLVSLDELQTYDSPNLAALLEQIAKYGGRGELFNQNPRRLSDSTWNAVATNRSHMHSTTVNSRAAQMISAEWGTPPHWEVLTRLERFTFLASVTVGREVSRPFLVHGIPAAELHAEHHRPEDLALLDEAIDHNAERQLVQERLAHIDGHAARIHDWLTKDTKKNETPRVSGPHVVRPAGGSRA